MRKIVLPYFITYLLLLGVMMGLDCGYSQTDSHILLNSWHTTWLDAFFLYFTQLAEWPIYVLALLPLCWKRYEWTLFYAACELTSAGIVQGLKHLFPLPRPYAVFGSALQQQVPTVPGVDLLLDHSFPSGHSATFFVAATVLVLLTAHSASHQPLSRAKRIALDVAFTMLCLIAAAGSYSRIYLSQHFLMDVCVGSLIGTTVPCILWLIWSQTSLARYRK